jgi:Zn-dependent M28 family amino/carboxypeptidase
MAYIPGKEVTDTFIVFTAHYDHLGKIGPDVIFRGANDNASGVAMMLSLAKYFSENRHLCKYSIAFIAFAGEEAGLIGSKFFTMNPVFPLKNIRLLVNVDLMGGGEDGITVVNAKENPRIFNLMKSINDELQLLKAIKERSNAPNSDHYYFAEAGVPAIFIYTMGTYKHYHDVNDRAENLQLTKFNQVFTLITELIKRY